MSFWPPWFWCGVICPRSAGGWWWAGRYTASHRPSAACCRTATPGEPCSSWRQRGVGLAFEWWFSLIDLRRRFLNKKVGFQIYCVTQPECREVSFRCNAKMTVREVMVIIKIIIEFDEHWNTATDQFCIQTGTNGDSSKTPCTEVMLHE